MPFFKALPPAWRGLPVYVRVTLGVFVVLWIATTLFMTTVKFSGDELFYAPAAGAIASFLKGNLPYYEMQAEVVGYGWFTPGMALVLTPLYLADQSPSLGAVRLYCSLFTLLLWLWAVWEVYRSFGARYAIALSIFPTLDITWRLFSATAWADVSAGSLLVIAVAGTWKLGCRIAAGAPLGLREVAALEIVLIVAFYLRGNLIAVGAATNLFLLVLPLFYGRFKSLPRHAATMFLGASILAAAIAPWSLLATRQLGDTVISTSTPVLSFGVAFGDGDLCLGPCPGQRTVWFEAVEFSRSHAAAQGISELEAQRRMMTYALRDLTFDRYLLRVRENFERFLSTPSALVGQRLLLESQIALSESSVSTLGGIAAFWTGSLYFPGLICLALANFIVVRGRQAQIESLCLKMFTLCLFLQPFFHVSHPRYWLTFGPLMALSAAFLAKVAARRPEPDGRATLVAVQGLYAALTVTVAMVILLHGS